jgi:hypothetical protein
MLARHLRAVMESLLINSIQTTNLIEAQTLFFGSQSVVNSSSSLLRHLPSIIILYERASQLRQHYHPIARRQRSANIATGRKTSLPLPPSELRPICKRLSSFSWRRRNIFLINNSLPSHSHQPSSSFLSPKAMRRFHAINCARILRRAQFPVSALNCIFMQSAHTSSILMPQTWPHRHSPWAPRYPKVVVAFVPLPSVIRNAAVQRAVSPVVLIGRRALPARREIKSSFSSTYRTSASVTLYSDSRFSMSLFIPAHCVKGIMT